MEKTFQDVITVDDNEGQGLFIVNNTYRVILSGAQTDGMYAIIDMLVPPGGGPQPHTHLDIQESFYVVDGEIDFKSDSKFYTAKKGSIIFIPKNGPVHHFKNNSNTTAHLICTVVPAGMDDFFVKAGQPVEAGVLFPPVTPDAEEVKRLNALSTEYGQVLYPPDYFTK